MTSFDLKLQTLAQDMVDTMRKALGVGLAAPQLGTPVQLAVIEYSPAIDDEKLGPSIPLFYLVNPTITHYSKESDVKNEGCLSIPNVNVEVERSKKVKVSAKDLNGKEFSFQTSGFLARIIQHEVDHLNGILITDRTNSAKIQR